MGFDHWEVGFGKHIGWEMGFATLAPPPPPLPPPPPPPPPHPPPGKKKTPQSTSTKTHPF